MGWALEAAGFCDVRVDSSEGAADETVIENMLLYYDEIREKYVAMGIMTADQIEREKRELRALSKANIPAVWGIHRATAVA